MDRLWSNLTGAHFMPHGHCYEWQPAVLWLHVGSDALIALAYYSIPASLALFARRRPDLGLPWVIGLFVAFIFACGTTHALAIWTVWTPSYFVEGAVKALTATLSVATAILLVRILPEALALPSPAALERANAAFAVEVARRTQAEKRYRTLLESAPDGLVICDASGTITFANTQIQPLFGMSPADLVGQPIETLLPGRLRELHVDHRTTYLREPRVRPMGAGVSLRARRRDGTEFPVEISLSPLETDDGTLVIAAIRDTTDRHRAEQTVRDYAGRLEALSRQLMSAHEVERRRIARELHDEVGQSLTALKLALASYRERLATPMLDESIEAVDGVLQRVREMALELRPALLDDLGLAAALRWLVDRHARRAGWKATVDFEGGEGRLPADVEICCFRVAQEALTNVMRHAEATHVALSTRCTDGGVELVVRDDGRGMDVARARCDASHGASMGLLGMEERVALIGGRLEIASTQGNGTTVRAFIPDRAV